MSGQRTLLLIVLLCLPWGLARAATDLFESEMVVSDQSAGVRNSALQAALREVVVRVSGQRGVLDTEPVQELLKHPEQLVQQYRYFTEAQQTPPVLKLWVRFDGDAIREAVQQQGLAYWGGERPDTLIWLAVEDRGRRYVVSADDDSDVHRALAAAARARGIPVVFPLMDLEDQAAVHFSVIWGGYFDKVVTASARYRPQSVLIGRLNRSPSGGWAARWELNVGGRSGSWTDSNQQLDALARQGIADVADRQAEQLAVATATSVAGGVAIQVEGIETLAAYARINNYLTTLTSVRKVEVSEVTPTVVRYSLQLGGSQDSLMRTIAIGTVLEPAPDGIPGNYRLRQ
ncbi:MAG: DUF2066 domain-containing protein [Pseudomonadota bacterium]